MKSSTQMLSRSADTISVEAVCVCVCVCRTIGVRDGGCAATPAC